MGKKEDGLIMGTLIFIGLFAVCGLILGEYASYTSKQGWECGANRRLAWGLSFMAAFCMWLVWACVYMSQMYPLIRPEISEH